MGIKVLTKTLNIVYTSRKVDHFHKKIKNSLINFTISVNILFIIMFFFSSQLLFCGCARPQLEAARHPGARPVACFSSLWRKENRLPAVQQPEEPRQVQRTWAGLLSEELRGRWAHSMTRVWCAIPAFHPHGRTGPATRRGRAGVSSDSKMSMILCGIAYL